MIAAALLAFVQAAPRVSDPEQSRCFRKEVHGGTTVMAYVGDRACVDLNEPRLFEGIWLNDFEGSRFIEGARTLEDARRDRSTVWLNRHDLLKPSSIAIGRYGRAHRVRFVGRSARDSDREPLHGYGHFGMSRGLVVVDELIEQADVGATSEVHSHR